LSSQHPYIIFNPDGDSLSFIGFNVDKNGNLLDKDGKVVQEGIMTELLCGALKLNGVPLEENFDTIER
jgi:hypothetical protein